MSVKKNFVSCQSKTYRLKTSEPGFISLSELIKLLPSSWTRRAAHFLTFILSLEAEHCFVSQAPKTQTHLIYLNRNNLGTWELLSYWFLQSVRFKQLVSFENSWNSSLLPESPKIILFDSWNPAIPLPKDANAQIETSFATSFKLFAKSKKRTFLQRKMHVFRVISATSTHDVDMIRFLAPECPVYEFDAQRIRHTASWPRHPVLFKT